MLSQICYKHVFVKYNMKIGVVVYTYKMKHSGVWGKRIMNWRPILNA